jgi:putative intracellular protease/amidase
MPRKGDQVAGSDTQVAAFLFGLARGATVEGAAAAAGMKAATLYYRRNRCAVFARVWREALEMWDAEAAEAAEAADSAEGEDRATIVRRHAGRGPMRKRKRPVEFDRERKQAFLDHFAETCNLEASAAAAGISLSAVYRALKTDAAFAEGFEEALGIGYLFLEAEALRQQREAQKTYRISPKGEGAAQAQSFERTIQLLREYKRGQGRIGRRPVEARLTKWSFDEAFVALEKRLAVFGLRVERGEGPPED